MIFLIKEKESSDFLCDAETVFSQFNRSGISGMDFFQFGQRRTGDGRRIMIADNPVAVFAEYAVLTAELIEKACFVSANITSTCHNEMLLSCLGMLFPQL